MESNFTMCIGNQTKELALTSITVKNFANENEY